jgi:hypothetical protein
VPRAERHQLGKDKETRRPGDKERAVVEQSSRVYCSAALLFFGSTVLLFSPSPLLPLSPSPALLVPSSVHYT